MHILIFVDLNMYDFMMIFCIHPFTVAQYNYLDGSMGCYIRNYYIIIMFYLFIY